MSETIQDDVLGTLTYEVEQRWFVGTVQYADKSATMYITTSQPDSISKNELEKAQTTYLGLKSRKASIDAAIVKDLLDLYNDGWRQEGDPILDGQQFLDSIEIESIVIDGGQVEAIWYTDGDLFGGHGIMARFDDSGNIRSVEIHG